MSDSPSLGLAIAFLGGLLSFLSPCVLPLVPSYLGFVTGLTFDEMGNRRRIAMVHAALFVFGFTVVFMLFGATATTLGRVLKYHQVWFQRIGGALIILFGLYTLGVFRIRWMDREARVHLDRKPLGYLGSVLVGMTFAAGWTPCIGPILGGILGLAATTDDVSRGMVLLGVYSFGLAVPFLATAFAVETFLDWFGRFRRHLRWIQVGSGILLLFVGVLLMTGQFTRMAAWLQSLTPEFLRSRL